MTQAYQPVSDFDLQDLGGGRFALHGEMSFETADRILRSSDAVFVAHDSVELDLREVTKADSAGLALLLEWKARVIARDAKIRYVNIPDSMLAIAKTTEVGDLI